MKKEKPEADRSCDLFEGIPRGGEQSGELFQRKTQEMPAAKFMPKAEILSDPNMRFDGSKVFLGVVGERVEKRRGLMGQDEFHVIGGTPVRVQACQEFLRGTGLWPGERLFQARRGQSPKLIDDATFERRGIN